jgi:hypothetical protein
MKYRMMPLDYELHRLTNLQRFKYNKTDPFYYSLNKIAPQDWFIFGSLTWANENRRMDLDSPLNVSQKYRERDFNRLMLQFCGEFDVKYRGLAYYRATEQGNAGEKHVHFLIARDRLEQLDAGTCANALESLWTRRLRTFDEQQAGVGTAVIEPYEAAKEHKGVKYCLKREFNEFYEPRDREDFISPALMKVIQKKDNVLPKLYLN